MSLLKITATHLPCHAILTWLLPPTHNVSNAKCITKMLLCAGNAWASAAVNNSAMGGYLLSLIPSPSIFSALPSLSDSKNLKAFQICICQIRLSDRAALGALTVQQQAREAGQKCSAWGWRSGENKCSACTSHYRKISVEHGLHRKAWVRWNDFSSVPVVLCFFLC